MKKAILYAIILLGGWAFSSCKKETSIENGGNTTANFRAQINGVEWAAASNMEQVVITQGMISITGVSSDNQEISISIADSAAGTYTLNQQSLSLAAYANLDSSSLYAFSTSQSNDTTKAGGVVSVTTIDAVHKTISGTFSFNVYRSLDGQVKNITQGVFNELPYTDSLPNSSPGDTVTATIDNRPWTGQSIQASALDGQLTLVGASLDGSQSIALIFPSYASPGVYPLTASTASTPYIAVYDVIANGTNNADPGASGSITVLDNNSTTSRIRGTFQFKTVDSTNAFSDHTITNGFFSVYYGQ